MPPVPMAALLLEASVEEKNFLGRGQYIRLAAGRGQATMTYNLSFTEPYFLGYRLAAGLRRVQERERQHLGRQNYSYEDQASRCA